jgi:hypothetical protein
MSTTLMMKCLYRADGLVCGSGMLFNSVTLEPILLEGTSVYCPACEGKGMLLTSEGRDVLALLEKFGRSQLRDIIEEILER